MTEKQTPKKRRWLRVLLVIIGVIVVIDIVAVFYFFNVSQVRNNKPVTSEVKTTSKNYPLVVAFDKLPKTTETLENHGVKLSAWYVPAAVKTSKTVIVVHGYRSDRAAMRQYAELYHKLGYNVLVPDNRGAGASGGNLISYGYWDKYDIIAWAKKLVAADSNVDITLFGVSMGGATVMMASGEASLPKNVSSIIEDCGYTNVFDEVSYQAKAMYNLPNFPIVYEVSLMSQIRAGWSYQAASSTKELAKDTRPILFIHGTADTYVPYYMLNQNIAALKKGTPYEVLRVKGAKHAMSFETNPSAYEAAVSKFLKVYNPVSTSSSAKTTDTVKPVSKTA
ncbi:MAG: alpha/beta hydrolase [Streptococcaceae bacterium]|jgi:fermentation-respiration switch protein FrsA (DUF1100 family)|nr:alpha/beta hydrolase [Streptococcaceae bacterium]